MTKPTNESRQNPAQEISDAELDAVNGGSVVSDIVTQTVNRAWELFSSIGNEVGKAGHNAALDTVKKLRG